MKTIITMLVGASCLALAACDVHQTKEAIARSRRDASGGQLPEFNVDGPP